MRSIRGLILDCSTVSDRKTPVFDDPVVRDPVKVDERARLGLDRAACRDEREVTLAVEESHRIDAFP